MLAKTDEPTHSRTARLLTGACIAIVGLCLAACGDTHGKARTARSAVAGGNHPASQPTSPSVRGLRGDEDDDNDTITSSVRSGKNDLDADYDNDTKERQPYYDADDVPVSAFGHPASPADSAAIESLVKRYYTAAIRGDGATGCSLMFSVYAESVPEDYGRGAGPVYARGNTCPPVISKMFRHLHREMSMPMRIVSIRIAASQARVLSGSKTQRARYLLLKRERGRWRVDAIAAIPLP